MKKIIGLTICLMIIVGGAIFAVPALARTLKIDTGKVQSLCEKNGTCAPAPKPSQPPKSSKKSEAPKKEEAEPKKKQEKPQDEVRGDTSPRATVPPANLPDDPIPPNCFRQVGNSGVYVDCAEPESPPAREDVIVEPPIPSPAEEEANIPDTIVPEQKFREIGNSGVFERVENGTPATTREDGLPETGASLLIASMTVSVFIFAFIFIKKRLLNRSKKSYEILKL